MTGSTIPRRGFGRLLRSFRERSQKSMLTAGLAIDVSPPTILRLEDGLPSKISTPQIERLLDIYQISFAERTEALEMWDLVKRQDKLAKAQGTSKGWWQGYSDVYKPYFDHYLRLEAAATHMTSHQLVLMPGILQVPEYRRALIRTFTPGMSAVDTERLLELAARRQARIVDNGLNLVALLSESVLLHQPGGTRVLAEQLHHLAEISERPNVSIRVIRHNVGTNPGHVVLSFTLLEFPPMASRLVEPPVVYIEGAEGALYLERGDVIDRYRQAISGIQAVALSEEDTRDLVLRSAKECSA
ncbi:helix-turn-helix domain-containing protein [Nocardia tengchongensis]|uniref:Helix-turn-helix domain-containing protein n=1 Tax=Nocardia tengchongensis TaxID=2055889 RepID=A0ABX8CLM2_9NOCA|nr:helix-turn-helix transcriptional regulator [Nocardia tengchongensis]QVI20854.1 helix-turn-helix domain-containing protein [Nocardia tengchongensis]